MDHSITILSEKEKAIFGICIPAVTPDPDSAILGKNFASHRSRPDTAESLLLSKL